MSAGNAETKYGRPKDCAAEFDAETGRCERCGLGWLLAAKDWPACQPMTIARYRTSVNRELSSLLGSFTMVDDLAKHGRAADPAAALNRAMEFAAVRRAFLCALDDPQIRQILKSLLNPERHAGGEHSDHG